MSTNTSASISYKSNKRFSRILLWVAVIVIVLFVSVYLAVGVMAASQLTIPKRRFPTGKDPGTFNLVFEEVRFPARGGDAEIAAWFIPNQESSQAVIIVHGNNESRTYEFSGNMVDLGAALHQAGFNVLMIDLRGHGRSGEGRASFGINERRDILGAVDWLLGRGFQPGTIGVLGTSLGGASGIGAASQEKAIGALVIDSTFAEIYPIIQTEWRTASGLPDLFLIPTRLMARLMFGYDIAASRPVEEIGAIAPRPILIIHCRTDQTIPLQHAERLHQAAPSSELWVIPECLHSEAYNADHQAYEETVSQFFNANLK